MASTSSQNYEGLFKRAKPGPFDTTTKPTTPPIQRRCNTINVTQDASTGLTGWSVAVAVAPPSPVQVEDDEGAALAGLTSRPGDKNESVALNGLRNLLERERLERNAAEDMVEDLKADLTDLQEEKDVMHRALRERTDHEKKVQRDVRMQTVVFQMQAEEHRGACEQLARRLAQVQREVIAAGSIVDTPDSADTESQRLPASEFNNFRKNILRLCSLGGGASQREPASPGSAPSSSSALWSRRDEVSALKSPLMMADHGSADLHVGKYVPTPRSSSSNSNRGSFKEISPPHAPLRLSATEGSARAALEAAIECAQNPLGEDAELDAQSTEAVTSSSDAPSDGEKNEGDASLQALQAVEETETTLEVEVAEQLEQQEEKPLSSASCEGNEQELSHAGSDEPLQIASELEEKVAEQEVQLEEGDAAKTSGVAETSDEAVAEASASEMVEAPNEEDKADEEEDDEGDSDEEEEEDDDEEEEEESGEQDCSAEALAAQGEVEQKKDEDAEEQAADIDNDTKIDAQGNLEQESSPAGIRSGVASESAPHMSDTAIWRGNVLSPLGSSHMQKSLTLLSDNDTFKIAAPSKLCDPPFVAASLKECSNPSSSRSEASQHNEAVGRRLLKVASEGRMQFQTPLIPPQSALFGHLVSEPERRHDSLKRSAQDIVRARLGTVNLPQRKSCQADERPPAPPGPHPERAMHMPGAPKGPVVKPPGFSADMPAAGPAGPAGYGFRGHDSWEYEKVQVSPMLMKLAAGTKSNSSRRRDGCADRGAASAKKLAAVGGIYGRGGHGKTSLPKVQSLPSLSASNNASAAPRLCPPAVAQASFLRGSPPRAADSR